MNKIFIFIFLSIIIISLLIVGAGSRVVGETPCVDDKNKVNLAGIMCEEKEYTFFGLKSYWGAILVFLEILNAYFFRFKNENTNK